MAVGRRGKGKSRERAARVLACAGLGKPALWQGWGASCGIAPPEKRAVLQLWLPARRISPISAPVAASLVWWVGEDTVWL